MILQQFYLACLSHASYLIGDGSSRRAVVVDPQRDVSTYLDALREHDLVLERVIETHFHADFVSGHLELAAQTGATICYGSPAQADFVVEQLQDGERISLGDVTLQILATPGHTPESISISVYEHSDDARPYAVLTGDTLFIGDVGRPDLFAASGVTPDHLARQLYRSLHQKLLTLDDATLVYPAHGAGSACGKHLSTDTWSTIGEQRRTNYALQPMSEDQFVAVVTEGQPLSPAYFAFSAQRNRERHELLGEETPPPWVSLDETLALQRGGATVLDTRAPADFAAGHLRGAVNVGLEGRFAEYAGDVVQPDRAIVLCSDPGMELEAKVRLARIGFDNVIAALRDPLLALQNRPDAVQRGSRISAAELTRLCSEVAGLMILDVRNPGELERGVIAGSMHVPMSQLVDRLAGLDQGKPYVVHCASGYRSSIAASVMRAAGFSDVSDLLGGFEAWELQTRSGAATA